MSNTAQLIDQHGITVLDHLDMEVDIPVLSGLQRQGDVIVIPAIAAKLTASTPVPATGTPVVRGESGGNTHTIVGEGPVFCDTSTGRADQLRVAVLTVPDGSTAWLAHPEHGFAAIAPGTYELRRQREQADELRMVAD
jgi:hypothetical protein